MSAVSQNALALAVYVDRLHTQGLTFAEILKRLEVTGAPVPVGYGVAWSPGVIGKLLALAALARSQNRSATSGGRNT